MNSNKKIIIILIILVAILAIALAGAIIYIALAQNNTSKNKVALNEIVNNNANNTTEQIQRPSQENLVEQSENVAVETFNMQFKNFTGTTLSAAQVRSLISMIQTNNSERTDNHIVDLDSEGIVELTKVENDKQYHAILSYDSEGYVNKVKIIEGIFNVEDNNNQANAGNIEAALFNSKFSSFIGDVTGTQVLQLMQLAQESMNTDPEHVISVNSNTLHGMDDILETEAYIITLQYDNNGYVNIINIEKKI